MLSPRVKTLFYTVSVVYPVYVAFSSFRQWKANSEELLKEHRGTSPFVVLEYHKIQDAITTMRAKLEQTQADLDVALAEFENFKREAQHH